MVTPKKTVTAEDMREIFNQKIQPRIDSGVYQLNECRSGLPHPSANQPEGTRSVIFEILDGDGKLIAKAHAYVLPDGSYGASGRLDPKHIRLGNLHYKLQCDS